MENVLLANKISSPLDSDGLVLIEGDRSKDFDDEKNPSRRRYF